MVTVPSLVMQLVAHSPHAALALLPAQARQAYTMLTQLPAMRAELNRGWNEYNTAIESGDTSAMTPAQRTAWNDRVRTKGVHLQAAQTQFDRLRAIYDQASNLARTQGITIPPPQAVGLAALQVTPLLVIAAAIGASAIVVAVGIIARELAAAGRIALGLSVPESDLNKTARFGLGVVGAVALLGLLFMLRRSS